MQLFFRSLILLIGMIAYGHAAEEAAKTATGQAPKPTTEQSDNTVKAQTDKAAPKQADNAAAQKTGKPKLITKPLPEMAMGSPKAPVVIINYSSLTCSHCAHFHTVVLPKIEDKYIKPGYVRIIFRDFPGDQLSLNAHRLAWSKGELKYLDFVKLLYSTQEKWLTAADPAMALKSIVLQNGVTPKQYETCLKDQELLDKIIQVRLEGQKKYNITATPTIIINAKIYPRAFTFEEFEGIVKPLLASTLAKDKKQLAQGKSKEAIKVVSEQKEPLTENKKDIIKVSEEMNDTPGEEKNDKKEEPIKISQEKKAEDKAKKE
ncbi:MAG TPA: thioredoxin domain-containing protein [Alphaproteobacteria bacterium]|nr:thioredoxin domain-containing protein [Alphaproteobacteria bacterium]